MSAGGCLVIFEPCGNAFAGVHVKETQVKIQKGSTYTVSVPIVNNTYFKLKIVSWSGVMSSYFN